MGEELKSAYERNDELEVALRLARAELDECWLDFVAAGKHSRAATVERRMSLIDKALNSEVV